MAATTGFDMKYHAMEALLTSARVWVALGEVGRAQDDAHRALTLGAAITARIGITDTLECLAGMAGDEDHQAAARLFGAADSQRLRIGAVRFKLYQPGYDADVSALRVSMGTRPSNTPGPRGRRCRSPRRSPTPSGDGASASARPAVGRR